MANYDREYHQIVTQCNFLLQENSRLNQQLLNSQAQRDNIEREFTVLKREKDQWKHCAQELRGSFAPNTRDHPAVQEYNSCCENYDPLNDYYEP